MTFTFSCPCGYRTDDIDAVRHEPVDGCCNCGGRECMACVFREWHDDCVHDCPDCCQEPIA